MSVGNTIKEARKKAGLTQRELSTKAGIGLASLQRYESGERSANFELLMKIRESLDISLSELVGEENTGNYVDDMRKDLFESVRTENGDIDLTEELVDGFIKLNYQGQEKAVWFVDLLSKLPEYLKPEDGLNEIDEEGL